MEGKDLIRTRIVDKNGKVTHVYKKPEEMHTTGGGESGGMNPLSDFNTPMDTVDLADLADNFEDSLDRLNNGIAGHETDVDPSWDDLRTQLAHQKAELYGLKDVMTREELDEILESIDEPDAGASWYPSGYKPTAGFCYSVLPERSLEIDAKDVDYNTISRYINDNMDFFENNDNAILGLWHSPITDKVYVDVSKHTLDATEAREDCLKYDQQSFFDLQTFNSVTVNEEATSGQGQDSDNPGKEPQP